MHTHMSLFEGDSNAFYEAGAPYQLSKVGRQFITGLLRHGAELTAVTSQWVNSYKRLWGGGKAPAHLLMGPQQPQRHGAGADVQPLKGQSSRVEVRTHGCGVQPLPRVRPAARRRSRGHRGGLRAPRDRGRRVEPHRLERHAMGIEPLPSSLHEAIGVMEKSELVADTLGEHVFDFFLRNKRAEWDDYRGEITR